MGRDLDRRNKRLRYARNKFDILTHTLRWTGQEIAQLYSWELHVIRKLLYRKPYRGKTTVYRQETVDAYWHNLMTQMPEGRPPEIKPIAD